MGTLGTLGTFGDVGNEGKQKESFEIRNRPVLPLSSQGGYDRSAVREQRGRDQHRKGYNGDEVQGDS